MRAQPVPKPSKEAQSSEDGATKVLLSDVYATAKTKLFGRPWNGQDYGYVVFMTVVHGLCLLAPFTFSWRMVALFFGTYFVTGEPPSVAALRVVYMQACGSCRWRALLTFDEVEESRRLSARMCSFVKDHNKGACLASACARRLPGHHAELPPAAEPPQAFATPKWLEYALRVLRRPRHPGAHCAPLGWTLATALPAGLQACAQKAGAGASASCMSQALHEIRAAMLLQFGGLPVCMQRAGPLNALLQ